MSTPVKTTKTAPPAPQSKYLALGVGMLGFAAAAAVTGLIARRR